MQPEITDIMPYQFAIDEDMAKRIGFDPNNPLAKSIQSWASKQGLNQEAFDGLVMLYMSDLKEKLNIMDDKKSAQDNLIDEYFGARENGDKARQETARWMNGLLDDQFNQNPELRDALSEFADTANGLKILHYLKGKISERAIPNNSAGQQSPSLTKEKLLEKMNSDIYFNPAHPQYESLHREVKRGFQQLYK